VFPEEMVLTLYKADNFAIGMVYNDYADVFRAFPVPNSSFAPEHVVHAVYTRRQGRGSIDVYLIRNSSGLEKELGDNDIKISSRKGGLVQNLPNSKLLKRNPENVFSIDYQRITGINEIWPEIKNMIDYDVAAFNEIKLFNNPKRSHEHGEKIVQKLIPSTTPNMPRDAYFFRGKGAFSELCLFDTNIDLSASCTANMNPEGYYFPEGDCIYCYASRHHDKPDIKVQRAVTSEILDHAYAQYKEEMKGQKWRQRVIRVGARVESAAKFQEERLNVLLEWCIVNKKTPIIITKYNQYERGSETVKLAKESKAVMMFSIGRDNMEPGPVLSGFTNEFRIEQAIKYFEAGVNARLDVLTDMHVPFTLNKEQFLSNEQKLAIEAQQKYGVPIQLLAFRAGSDKVARAFFGKSYKGLKTSEGQLFEKNQEMLEHRVSYAYTNAGNNELVPEIIHPEILEGATKGAIGLCAKTGKNEYCSGCGLYKNVQIKEKNHQKMDYGNTKSKSNVRKRQKAKTRGMESLF
jgi:hypothetical protein